MAKPHTQLVKAILQWLELRGIMAWSNNTGASMFGKRMVRFGMRGAPDIIGILPGGRFLGVEAKIMPDVLSAEQDEWHARAEAQGALMIVAYSVDDVIVASGGYGR